MDLALHDIVGAVGVVCILGAYAANQADRFGPEQPAYSILNAVGAGLILVSLSVDFNLSAAVIEGFWLIISLYGLFRRRKTPSKRPGNRP